MVKKVFGWLTEALSASVGWFDIVLVAIGMVGVFLAVMFIMLSFRYILAPLLGTYSGSIAEERAFKDMKRNTMSAQHKRSAQYSQKNGKRGK